MMLTHYIPGKDYWVDFYQKDPRNGKIFATIMIPIGFIIGNIISYTCPIPLSIESYAELV